jgi:hypothetical protein
VNTPKSGPRSDSPTGLPSLSRHAHWSSTTSQAYVHLDAADIREALYRAGFWQEESRVTSAMPAGQDRPRLRVAGGGVAALDGRWASDHWDAGGWTSRPARTR